MEKARASIIERLLEFSPIFGKTRYMLGDEFSMLDVAIAPLLWRLDHYGIKLGKSAAPLIRITSYNVCYTKLLRSRGYRLADAERIADREHDVAHAQRFGLAEGDCRQAFGFDAEHREIGIGVAADHARKQSLSVRHGHLDLVGGFRNNFV